MKSCITISIVPEAKGGPFVFWDGLENGCQIASELGFDAIEIFSPGPEALELSMLKGLLEKYNLKLGGLGTGAGILFKGYSLASGDAANRAGAVDFVKSMIDIGGPLGAKVIVGSIQGKAQDGVTRGQATDYLAEGLEQLGAHAATYGTPMTYEPINRYETNIINTQADGRALLDRLDTDHVVLLADLFHMNMEEVDVPQAILDGKGYIGHVHFVDSNRRAAGGGHLNMGAVTDALKDIGYHGYLCAECFPYPDSRGAAEQTIATFKKYFG